MIDVFREYGSVVDRSSPDRFQTVSFKFVALSDDWIAYRVTSSYSYNTTKKDTCDHVNATTSVIVRIHIAKNAVQSDNAKLYKLYHDPIGFWKDLLSSKILTEPVITE